MSAKEDCRHHTLPPLIKAIAANEVDGFDEPKPSVFMIEAANVDTGDRSISISMPPSPLGEAKGAKFHSQPMPKPSAVHPVYDKRFNSFKTWSGKLERQISNLRGIHLETEPSPPQECFENVAVHRYFDALEGPELDTLRASEEIILPEDKQWPFLLRFPISTFGICLGLGSQAIMWKSLSSSPATAFLDITPHINLTIWLITAALTLVIAIIYALKLIFYFEAVHREYCHPVRVNFFFAPWITLLFLALGVPPSIAQTLPAHLWYILMAPILCLELKIYGQWMSGGQRRLSKVANPTNHLSVVGNFVGAFLGASMGLTEGPIFFFAVGMAHYMVLFVTLYQRLPTNQTLPKELHPVFFLFIAAPSVASLAWAKIQGSFDSGSRIAYFIALFLYASLAVRVNFFRGFKFSMAWWAYTFPMTAAALAAIKYSGAVTCRATQIKAVMLCLVATVAVAALLVNTVVHAVVHGDLFPNDMAIAISKRRPRRRWYHKRSGSSDSNIEKYLKFIEDGKDVEASLHSSSSTTSQD